MSCYMVKDEIINKFEGVKLPYTSHGWTRQFKGGSFRNGGTWNQVEKVKAVGRGTGGAELEEVHILASRDIDQDGNKKVDVRKGQHHLRLKKEEQELAFAIQGIYTEKNGWIVLGYDCTYCKVVKNQQQAEQILSTANWRKWAEGRR